jgi:uncharacterized RDD family membrane protein YckC
MSQIPDWNAPDAGQATPSPQYGQAYQQAPQYGRVNQQAPQYGQVNQQAPQYGQVNQQGMMMPTPGYGIPGMATAPVPDGMYYDQLSGLLLPNGTQLASVGRRIGSYFLAGLLVFVTLGIGYLIWGAISWSNGQTPTQQVLGMQTWRPQTRTNATWGEQFLRELSRLVYCIPFVGIVSFFVFASSKDRRSIHDQIGGTIVLHDPNKVLQPTAPR